MRAWVMEISLSVLVVAIALAFVFDFTNGFHDAANSMATLVATKVLRPWQAVLWAAVFNFLAFFFFKLAIAQTIGTGLIHPAVVDPVLILVALSSAIVWNLLTAYAGLPSSSSHALIGGLAGAALAKGGLATLEWLGFAKVLMALFLSPCLGLGLSWLVTRGMIFCHKPWQRFRRLPAVLQLLASAFLSLTHGGNDAQKTMGLIAVLLAQHSGVFSVPVWVVFSCYGVLALGTLSGGWRIIRTMGEKITSLNRLHGSGIQLSAAVVILAATGLGVPVSTTHTVTGAVAGAGLAQGVHALDWQVLKKILGAWLLTLPATAGLAGLVMWVVQQF